MRYWKVAAEMKHWTAYGVESNRMGFAGEISVHDLSDTYFKPLKMALAVNISSAMWYGFGFCFSSYIFLSLSFFFCL
jgi:hypothetical protein